MSKAETSVAVLIVVIGVAMLYEALKLPYFIDAVPGPGYLPRWIAGAIVLVGVILTAKAIRPALADAPPANWPAASGWIRVGTVLGGLAVSLILLEKLGFVVTTTAFMSVILWCLGVRSFGKLLTIPLFAAVLLYLVFSVWLGVPLPKGILESLG